MHTYGGKLINTYFRNHENIPNEVASENNYLKYIMIIQNIYKIFMFNIIIYKKYS